MGTCIVLYSCVSNSMKIIGIGVPYIKQCRIVRANLVRRILDKSLLRKAYVRIKALTDNGVPNCCVVYPQERETLKRVFSGISSIRTDFCTYFLLHQFPDANS